MNNGQKLGLLLEEEECLLERCAHFSSEIEMTKANIAKLATKKSATAKRLLEELCESLGESETELEFDKIKLDSIPKLMYDENLYIKEQAPLLVAGFLKYLKRNIEECFLTSSLKFCINSPQFTIDGKSYLSGQMGIYQEKTSEFIAISEKFYLGKYWFHKKGFTTREVRGITFIKDPAIYFERTSRVQAFRDYEKRFKQAIIKELKRRFYFTDFSLTIKGDTIIIELL